MIDFSTMKKIVIPEGEVKQIVSNGVLLWKNGPNYTNLVPKSTDTDGSIYNGVGYKENVRLSSTGGISSSAQNGSVTTGFIPWGGDTSWLRMSGVEWVVESGKHYYVNCYDANKKFLEYLSVAEYEDYLTHIASVTRVNGVTTIKFSETYGTTNVKLQAFRSAKYIRITAKGKGADMIVTINEEIE